jgi:A/G-specific adenine glycosylase
MRRRALGGRSGNVLASPAEFDVVNACLCQRFGREMDNSVTQTTEALDTSAVLSWGLPRLRDLPWRRTREPWAILLAEMMLQQTQVDRVVPKWQAFLDAYPTPTDCAAATLGDVLRLWQGLGYPRRARNLRDAAIAIVRHHSGAVPDGLDDLLALPGVGPYTARAVRVFAFEHDEGVVETNIARLIARVVGARQTAKRVQAVADKLVPHREGWAWNQVLMDLGATVCRPMPSCDDCPIARSCSWYRDGHAEPDPAVGSAGVSTAQPPYEGSLRQARGRVLKALTDGAAGVDDFPTHVVAGLVADRLVIHDGDRLSLP